MTSRSPKLPESLALALLAYEIEKNQFLGASGGMAGGAVGDDGQPGASAKELWDENQKLKRENAYLKRQREILKKAASILAEDPQLGMR